ncbi:helix-turn-helix domain-containing protein [Rhizobium miluonense]|uniref:helix-turn-helix domain-containing protein n=1 Tax=Rhizobium miluonense TaxID=411945 RepID=UPI000B89267F|nr:helix-turn-helix transcriptional regulator [Rhizobium miluonense]
MNGVQCRSARVALGWSVRELAEIAGASTQTIVRFEKGEELRPATIDRIKRALEDGGITFIPADEHGGPGIRFTHDV